MKVSVALITDDLQRVLITQRAVHISHGGFWEFPGGKLEPKESPEKALFREVKEEVGLDVLACRYIDEVYYQYDDYAVTLYGYHVYSYRGQAKCCEAQTGLSWVTLDELANYNFPRANQALINKFMENNI